MSLLSTSTELIFANTTVRPGTIVLPDTFQMPGRIITIKDLSGAWGRNRLTLATSRNNQTLDGGSFSTFLTTGGGWATLIAGDNQRWYTIGGTQLNTVTASTIQSSAASIQSLSTGTINISTLTLMDNRSASTNSLYCMSTLLFYTLPNNQSSIVAGTRQATGNSLLPMRRPFLPTQIANLGLWLDATDTNTIQLLNGGVVGWLDKSTNKNNANGRADPPKYSSNSIVFDTGTQYLTTPYSASLQNETMFMVSYLNAAQTASTYPTMIASSGNGGRQLFLYQTLGFQVNTQAVANGPRGGSPSSFQNVLYSYTCTSGSPNNTINLYINASNVLLNGSLGPFTAGLTSWIGRWPGGNPWVGSIREIIGYSSVLNDAQRQQVEGYLAWKWGIVGNIPSSNAYKNSPP